MADGGIHRGTGAIGSLPVHLLMIAPVIVFYLLFLIGFGLLVVIRPLIGWLSLFGTSLSSGDKLIVGFFGVRGIGSVYYLGYASGKVEFVNEEQLWALVAFTIFASSLLHGATSFMVEKYASRRREPTPV